MRMTFYFIARDLLILRGPAPKKQPMISDLKLKSAQILLKNEFLLLQFRFKPKISSCELVTSDSSIICPKICPFKNQFRNHYRRTK